MMQSMRSFINLALVATIAAVAGNMVGCCFAAPSSPAAAAAAAADAADRTMTLLSRQRRRVDQLGEMVSAAAGRHFSEFLGYGNFCGFRGSGEPVDSVDACCQAHDRCFGMVQAENEAGNCTAAAAAAAAASSDEESSPSFNIYLSRYNYSIGADGMVECLNPDAADAGDGSDGGSGSGGYPRCQRHLCECDKVFSECLKRHAGQYNSKHLSKTQAPVRALVKLAEESPKVYAWVWESVAKMMGEPVTASPSVAAGDDGSNFNGVGCPGSCSWLLTLVLLLLLQSLLLTPTE